ncbi:MAG: 4-(cytidine 5'-diphospho)-2-C-methyl-D-erythritol kinase [Gemmatimonadales bacterium]|nr:4-(cytidine 5'-diphospho)-2-C-methyl-D-erythritol kinase [Gemmatimonadales bacterium]NIN12359.1 4-(cytidine 5'-diphospho)-2-C-methyl-D-erythritol kinase [Gemmatimonadales bacterium]NIN48897.1 4-(cytidine 5'-diphospho)-2-C-methyl-D-erythritol kinase [Gemmatimonadales bacterium]NIP06361.1 4-(cytidine 5'-diphospho)-2-C-methyl-D-erythritol kinase [Gemmatimonadales bacterium]NIR00734.1 4-(cytidine 5'-diphospho)-2-C-methyl-D-erythritol kinase [Gemmatimonadales bacterium]
MPDSVTIPAHAKANLFLRILSREASGFHCIETLFTLLELHDELTVEQAASGIELSVEGADTGPAEQNLAHRAATMVLEATGNRFGVRMHLTKRIPVMAGLGGGSSDGAAALHAVNRLAADAVPRHEILQFAARLGSDVPFFASGASLALAWGRGERLFRLRAPKPAPALIVVPGFGINTKRAYELFDTTRGDGAHRGAVVLDESVLDNWGAIGRLGGNDFESPVFGKEPRLRELFERVAATRPLLVRLSGSGSATIGVYKSEAERDGAALEIGQRDWELIKTTTRQGAAPGPT